MSDAKSVKRQALRSTSIIGGATIASLLIGLLKTKVIAVLIGPAGVGLLGTLSALMVMGASVATMGLDTTAVRQLSVSLADPERLRIARRAIWSFAWTLSIAGAAVFWLFRLPLSSAVFGSTRYRVDIGWLSLGLAATVISVTQIASVQAWQRMGDVARIRIGGSAIAALVGVAAIYQFGENGIFVAVVITPIATCLAALMVKFSTNVARTPISSAGLIAEWRVLLSLGIAVTFTTLIGSLSQSAVRAILIQKLGLSAAGLFQASFTISSLNLGFLLGAMVPEFYPRLSAESSNVVEVSSLVNHQLHVSLMLAAPALLGLSAFAPIVLRAAYSGQFVDASLLLRLQLTADAFRIAGWALGLALLARKRTATYVGIEPILALVFVSLTWLSVGNVGYDAAGGAFLVGYAASLGAVWVGAARDGIRINRSNNLLIGLLAIALLAVAATSLASEIGAEVLGVIFFLAATAASIRELARLAVFDHWANRPRRQAK